MIDIENQVFTKVATALRSAYSGINVKSRLDLTPSEFPCVCIEECDNYAYQSTQDSASGENHALVMYEVNAYSQKVSGAKQECKAIFATVDSVMEGLGFTRTNRSPVDMDDVTKYRLVGRYQAVVSDTQVIFRR